MDSSCRTPPTDNTGRKRAEAQLASDLNKNEGKRVAFISRIWDRTQDQLDVGKGNRPSQLEIISCRSTRSAEFEPTLRRGLHSRRREEWPLPWRCLGR
jgi:hypothetical protein